MSARPTEPSDEPEAVDQVMLSVLSNRGRDATVLTAEQERLLDDWVAGRLAAPDAERAAALTRQNTLAAERILERRLQQAAERGPAVPESLRARVLGAAATPRTSTLGAWWRSLRRRQWLAIAGAVALASIVVVVGGPVMRRAMLGEPPIQVAMVTIGDRSPLFEASDVRMRGASPQPPPADQRFRDVEMPVNVLRNLLAAPSTTAARDLESYLPPLGVAGSQPARVMVDDALRGKLDAADRIPVRIYDLRDPRAADIRAAIGPLPETGSAYLLTVKP
jgi:hypothetical protein